MEMKYSCGFKVEFFWRICQFIASVSRPSWSHARDIEDAVLCCFYA